MPRPGEYTPRRRRVMQAVMWTILAGAVALASVVARSANRANRVDLTPQPISARNVSVRLPVKWGARSTVGDDPRMIAQAVEPESSRGPGRTLRVLVDRVDTPVSPLQYLAENFAAPLPGEADSEDMSYSILSAVDIAGYPGSAITLQHGQPDPRSRGEVVMMLRKDVYACAVLPSLQVIVIHLSGQYTPADATDQELVHQIAGAMTVSSQVKFEPDESVVMLPQGIQLSTPRQFGAVVRDDPNRTDRLFWRRLDPSTARSAEKFNQNWTALEVVGCLFPSLNASDARQKERATAAMQTLLLVRDGRWRGAVVNEENGAWRASLDASPSALGGEAFPATAYLLPDPSGRALLAIFHGGWGGGGFDAAWKQLAEQTKFLPASDVAQLEDAGAAEAARLRREDWSKHLADRDEQWWLLTDQSDHPHVGWSNLRWQTGKLAAEVDVRERGTAGEVARVNGQWELRGAGNYSSDMTLTESRAGRIATVQQKTTLARNQLTIGFRSAAQSLVKEAKMPALAQFVPGELLPLIMGELSPGPMLLKTESFIDCQLVAAPEPLAVIIRPGPPSKRTADGDEQPMRCVTAEVNGSGRVSRWYFRSTGELESVELAGDAQRIPSDSKSIGFDFGKDGQMAP